MAEELEVVEGDFGSIGGNYFGQMEMENNPNAGNFPLVGLDNTTVMLSTANDVIFMGRYISGQVNDGNRSARMAYLLPEECRPKATVFVPIWALVYANNFDVVVMAVSPSGEVSFRNKADNSYIGVKQVYLNGVSFNISDKYYG